MTTRGRGCMVAGMEYQLKRAITFDPTVGSLLNFSTSYFPCGSYGMVTR
jgi:hypothetical protein